MTQAVISDIKMHYQTKGEGPDVILVHGLTANLAFWYNNKVFPLLSTDHRVTAYDLRGHGYSALTPTGYTSRELAGDLLALMDHNNIEQARLIGHSFGGSIALHFAQLYPDRTAGVVLCDTGFAALRHLRNIKDWPGWELWKDELKEYDITYDWFLDADEKGIKEILSKSAEMPVLFGIRQGQRRDVTRFRKLLDETSVAADFRKPAGLTEESLPDIRPPVLAVYGEISPFQRISRYLADRIPNCTPQVVPGAGHFFLMDHTEMFLKLAGPFLSDPTGYVLEQKKLGELDGQVSGPVTDDEEEAPRKVLRKNGMKRILLVSPPRGSDFPRREDRPVNDKLGLPAAVMPPLDLATIAALTPAHFEVEIWDESVRGEITEATDLGKDYDLVGVTGYMTHVSWALNLGEIARRRGIMTAIGGPGVSSVPERCRGAFDVVFIGEAELTWPEFLEDWEAGTPRREYRQVERPDIEASPAPRWTGFDRMSQDYLMGPVQTTRGCPFDCEFCDVIHLFGRKPRHKAIDTVLQEVAALEKLGIRMIFFCDDNFVGQPSYTKELLRKLIPLNNSFDRPLGYTTQLTINVAGDEELLELLADANFHWVLIGIESPRESCLREANKPQNFRTNLAESVRKIQSYGVLVKGNMIVGFDHDDTDIFDETYDFLRECGVMNTGLSLLKAYPGTPLLARLQREGRIIETDDDVCSDITRAITNVIPKQMTRVELLEGYKRLFHRLRSWEHVGACAKTVLENITRTPNVPRRPPDPAKVAVVRSAIQSLDEEARTVVLEIIQAVWQKAPFMMERMISTLFRFGGNATAAPRVINELQKRIDTESAVDFEPRIAGRLPSVPAGFREMMRSEGFSKTYNLLLGGLSSAQDVPNALIRVWKAFLIRWGSKFEKFEDYHIEYLQELCHRTIEEGNSGEFGNVRVRAEVDGLSGVQLRRLADEVLVCVEQDLEGVTHD